MYGGDVVGNKLSLPCLGNDKLSTAKTCFTWITQLLGNIQLY